MTLPAAFLSRPIAHRGLHGQGIPENSRAAFLAAIEAGYGIELDIQPASDGTPYVFHDSHLGRMCDIDALITQQSPDDLARLRLLGSDESVPSLEETLALVAGRAPLLIEIKDQDGALGSALTGLESRVADLLRDYAGPAAVMSFNPHSVTAFGAALPSLPRGIITCGYDAETWPMLTADRRRALAAIEDFDRSGASFVSHHHLDLANPAIAALKARELPVLCWTTRSMAEQQAALRIADNVTFEGYLP